MRNLLIMAAQCIEVFVIILYTLTCDVYTIKHTVHCTVQCTVQYRKVQIEKVAIGHLCGIFFLFQPSISNLGN